MKKIRQKDVLMIKSLQPSVSKMKWPALAGGQDDLSPSTGSICCIVDSKATSSRCLEPSLVIKTSSVVGFDPVSVGILEDLLNKVHHMLPDKDKKIN